MVMMNVAITASIAISTGKVGVVGFDEVSVDAVTLND